MIVAEIRHSARIRIEVSQCFGDFQLGGGVESVDFGMEVNDQSIVDRVAGGDFSLGFLVFGKSIGE